MSDEPKMANIPVDAIWCAYKLAPSIPLFPLFNISEGLHGQNRVTILSVEKGHFETEGQMSRRIDPKRTETFEPMMISIPWHYRLLIQMEDKTVNTVYTNDQEAEWLFYLMSSVQNLEKYRGLVMSGKWDDALLEVKQMCNSFVDSATDKASVEALAKQMGITLGP